jgi:hypothetical protein
MSTISWKDLDFAEVPGIMHFNDMTLMLDEEHIRKWKDDPDGRYSLKPQDIAGHAELDKFFPSL